MAGNALQLATPMTRFIDAFKNERDAMVIKDELIGGLIAVVIVFTIMLIGKQSGNSFKAAANAF